MTREQFEAHIQREIDSELTVRVNPNADDIAGVYWRDAYVGVAVPSGEIREEYSESYVDAIGHPYRSIDMAVEMIRAKLPKVQDPENYQLLTQKI